MCVADEIGKIIIVTCCRAEEKCCSISRNLDMMIEVNFHFLLPILASTSDYSVIITIALIETEAQVK